MPNKSFSIYTSEDFIVEENDELVIEIANSHLACLVTKDNKRSIVGFELFTFLETESERFDELFVTISADSKILSATQNKVSVFFNNDTCLPVPIFKFNKQISQDYLNLVFGEDHLSTIHFQNLPIEPGIMNVFRFDSSYSGFLSERFKRISFHHTYSNFIKRVVNATDRDNADLISIQFYNTFIIVVVMKNGVLQLVQTFLYETPDDLLYYLLNVARQFDLKNEVVKTQICGMIDLDFTLYRQLITHFKQVVVENVKESNLLLQVGDNPRHYFTPFFNLAI